jgi:hypothetical protein
VNCQSHEKWITDLWKFEQKTKWRMLAVCAIVCATLAYHSHLSAICFEMADF